MIVMDFNPNSLTALDQYLFDINGEEPNMQYSFFLILNIEAKINNGKKIVMKKLSQIFFANFL